MDPYQRACRWYVVGVQATLLEPWAVVCRWGSLRTRSERWRIIPCGSAQIVAQKWRRGYV
jgi:hypothetical protein